jgi:hypothetical protein
LNISTNSLLMLAHPVKYPKYNTPEQVRVRYESQADYISSNCDGGSDGNDGNSSDGHTATCSCRRDIITTTKMV